MMVCETEIGSIYRNTPCKEDSVEHYINEALNHAKLENNNIYVYTNLMLLAEYYSEIKHDNIKSKIYANYALSTYPEIADPDGYYILATTYARLHQPDSAEIVLRQAPQNTTSVDSLQYYCALYEIELSKNNPSQAHEIYLKLDTISDSILIAGLNDKLLAVEKKFDKKEEELKNERLSSHLNHVLLVLAVIVLACVVLVLLILRYRQSLRHKEVEFEMVSGDLKSSLAGLEQMQARLKDYESKMDLAEKTMMEQQLQVQATVNDLALK